jgi:hypothetical protein
MSKRGSYIGGSTIVKGNTKQREDRASYLNSRMRKPPDQKKEKEGGVPLG